MATQPLLPFEAEASVSSSRLIEALGRFCAESPLEEKILVAPSLAIGHQTIEALARAGHRAIHLRAATIRLLAQGIVGPELAREGKKLLSRAQALALVEQACAEMLGDGLYFGQLRDRPGLHRALQRAFDELRAGGMSPADLPASAFSDARKPRELRQILERYETALEAGHWIDRAEVLRRAADRAEQAPRPGEGPRYLCLGAAELSRVERRLLEALAHERLVTLETDPPQQWALNAASARIFRATGEENEVRAVFREILAEGVAFDDVEILHTDSAVYPALLFELASEHEVPATFAGGIAVSYTHTARAALAFLDWVGNGFEAEVLREALASGHLAFPKTFDTPGAGPLSAARELRKAGIGWGRPRHTSVLTGLIEQLSRPVEAREDEAERTRALREAGRLRRLAAASAARRFIERALSLAPEGTRAGIDALARGARLFMMEFARVTGDLDATGSSALQQLFGEFEALTPGPIPTGEAVARLSDAVRALHVAADRPRPGRLHVAEYRSGGFSGRRHTYLIGLDESRHPGADLEDPVLSDEERREINAAGKVTLLLGADRSSEKSRAMRSCLARLRGEITFGYCGWNVRNLVQAGEVFPAPFLLEVFRQRAGESGADFARLAGALVPPAGFVPEHGRALDDGEWWLSRIEEGAPRGRTALQPVLALYPWLADGRRAEDARSGSEFTEWDGWVGEETTDLDPRSNLLPLSSSRVQTLARCPYAYFLEHVLEIEAPEKQERNATRWLDPAAAGKLVHEIFREFFQQLGAAGKKPDFGRDLPLLEEIAEREILSWREKVPPASELAFRDRRDDVLFACRTFLRIEEAHCRDVTPRFFELSFGLPRAPLNSPLSSPDPVEIPLGGGRSFRLRGSIDRVDEARPGEFHVWDYKTGSSLSIQEEKALRGGRQVQHALYAMALEALLSRSGRPGRVSRAGYFFPGRKGQGQRFEIPVSVRQTQEVLNTLFDLLRAGRFPRSADANDCRFCDFTAVCGDAKTVAGRSKAKLAQSADPALTGYRDLDHG